MIGLLAMPVVYFLSLWPVLYLMGRGWLPLEGSLIEAVGVFYEPIGWLTMDGRGSPRPGSPGTSRSVTRCWNSGRNILGREEP